jgi:hypothetical protein
MPSEGFEFAIRATKRLETYALDCTATAIGGSKNENKNNKNNNNNNDNRQAEPKMCATGKFVLSFARNCLL